MRDFIGWTLLINGVYFITFTLIIEVSNLRSKILFRVIPFF